VPEPVKRRYTSPQRKARAERTRLQILTAARELFLARGYAATAIGDIAARAGCSIDTIYSSVGRKPQLMLAIIDQTLASSDKPLPAGDRDYVRAVRAAVGAEAKLRTYADALGRLMPRVSPLFAALREAAVSDPECAALHSDVAERRAANMRLLAGELRATGEVRPDLDDEQVADLIWATNAPEWHALVMTRGWSQEEYADRLFDLWIRVLLRRA
jgi:AcrR family transcriptional regulator